MTATTKKSPVKSVNAWTGLATIVMAAFAYFQLTPDADAAQALSTNAHSIVDAISAKNLMLAITGFVNLGNMLYHLFLKK